MKYLIVACLCLVFGCSNPVGVVENDQEISLYKKPGPSPPCPDRTKPPKGQKCKMRDRI